MATEISRSLVFDSRPGTEVSQQHYTKDQTFYLRRFVHFQVGLFQTREAQITDEQKKLLAKAFISTVNMCIDLGLTQDLVDLQSIINQKIRSHNEANAVTSFK